MYAIRSKNTKSYLKLVNIYKSKYSDKYELDFADHCIEINYYVNDSLGFISNVLLRNSVGENYEPNLSSSVDQHSLEVVDLKSGDIVSLEELLDGCDVDVLPAFIKVDDEDNDIVIHFR